MVVFVVLSRIFYADCGGGFAGGARFKLGKKAIGSSVWGLCWAGRKFALPVAIAVFKFPWAYV